MQPRSRGDGRWRDAGQVRSRTAHDQAGGVVSDLAAAPAPAILRHRRPIPTEDAVPPRATVRICEAASCLSARSADITARLAELTGDSPDVLVKRVGCLGLCAAGPLVEIAESGELFEHVTPE